MNSIKALAGGVVPVVVINPNLVFACAHVTNPFSGAITLSKEGAPYPTQPQWHRFNLKDGSVTEENQSTFTVRDTITVSQNGDGVFYQTYRSLPVEAVEFVAAVKIGDTVVVESNRTKTSHTAKVINVSKGNGYLSTDYKAYSNDSASLVKDTNGNFVGFISAQLTGNNGSVEGSIVVVPETGVEAGGTPMAPNPNQPQIGNPTPTLPVVTPPPTPSVPDVLVISDFDKGFAAGKKSLAQALKAKVDDLSSTLNSFLA